MIYTSSTPPEQEYELKYYTTAGGDCPVKEMLDAMPLKHRAKTWKFFRLLEEKGIQHHGYRFLHFYAGKTIVMTHGFLKKTPRTPPAEIERAERYMNDWLRRTQI